jgi:hypothetical protein
LPPIVELPGEQHLAEAMMRQRDLNNLYVRPSHDMAYERRRDAERGIKRSSSEETEMRRATESHFENVFWIECDEPIVDE